MPTLGLRAGREEKTMSGNAEQAKPQAHAQGLSNTPAIPYNVVRHIETIIDYLKVTFFYPRDDYDPDFRKYWDSVLDALLVDRETCVVLEHGRSNFDFGWTYHEDLFVFSGGELTKSNGADTSALEMKGMACRRFEKRIVDQLAAKLKRKPTVQEENEAIAIGWKRVLDAIAELPHRCTRIDLTVDDFGGNVPIAELMRKCKAREFVSRIKKGFDANGLPLKIGSDEEEAIIREGLGWSFTLGSMESERQLCIYDKKAEIENSGKGLVPATSWIRFESRFKGDRADFMLDALTERLTSGDPMAFRRFVIGALSSIIEFKEQRLNGENTYKSAAWGPWIEFIKDGQLPPKFKAKVPVKSIKNNALEVKKDADGALFRLHATHKERFLEILAYLIRDGLKKADGNYLSMVNAARADLGAPTYESVEEMQEAVAESIKEIAVGKEVLELFDEPIEYALTPDGNDKKEEGEE